MITGQVIKNVAGKVLVKSGTQIFDCIIRGKVKNDKQSVLVGDFCTFDEKACSIEKILPRKNELSRPPVSNLDQIVIFVSSEPEPDFFLIDKLLINADKNNLKPIIILSKEDLFDKSFENDIFAQYSSLAEIIVTSTKKYHNIDLICEILKNKFSAFVGQSGVGKSTLLKTIINDESIVIGDLSQKDGRGKNTTRASQIYYLPFGGMIVDTPGFNFLNLDKIKSSDLSRCYKDIEVFAKYCKYRSCNHQQKADECAVKDAVLSGKLNKKRYDRFSELYKKLKESEDKKYV